MKKYLCLLLALTMLLTLFAGCTSGSDDDAEDIRGTIEENEDEEDEKETEEDPTEEESTEEESTEEESTEEESTEEATGEVTEESTEETVAEEENSLSLGRMEGGTYINNYAGFACKLDSNWVYYTSEELQELPDSISDAMSGSELGEAMENYTQIFDMSAENAAELTTMNVVYTKLSLVERAQYLSMTEEQIADLVLTQKDQLAAAYSQAGINLHSMEKTTVTFLGEERFAVYSVCDVQGIPYYILQVYDYTCGEYAVTLTLASYVDDNTAGLLALFYAVE